MEEIEQTTPEEENKQGKAQKTILSYLHDLVFGLVAVLLLFMLVFRVIVVSGSSMEQTLYNGDCIILLSSVLYNEPKQGDIVVINKYSYENGKTIIKRVIATEGQTVEFDFEKRLVFVDGVQLEEDYAYYFDDREMAHGDIQSPYSVVVDEGCVFVMGDNRNNSLDSRSSVIGQVDCREILGKALFLAFPGMGQGEDEARNFKRIGVLW